MGSVKGIKLAEKSSYLCNKSFLIENKESKGHVSIRKELIWNMIAFSIRNWASKGHVISRK